MNKLYSVHDHWTDINKKNDVDIESIDGVITGIKVNGEDYGGGGETWNTVFEGNVTTATYVEELNVYSSDILYTQITGDSIKVTFNGNEYILPKTNDGYGATNEDRPDLNEYPIYIATPEGGIFVLTQTAGTYSLKIEEPQSGGGGSSDFSTAEVTIIGYNGAMGFLPPSFPYVADNNTSVTMGAQEENSHIYTVVLYKGSAWGVIRGAEIKAMTGGVELSQDEEYLIITGDGTLTIEPF